jgi:uncharacterized protein YndB with AHSA1/START domain
MSAQMTAPPVLRSVAVAVDAERAFEVFTRRIGDWWPLAQYGCFGEETDGVAFEGARLVERSKSGGEAVWGEILAWEPPFRIAFTWHPGAEDGAPMTEVEVRFRPQGGSTTVELEHTGWERLGEGWEESRSQYENGWPAVLDLFAQAM